MSDKFFFKGRQDKRENHVLKGFETKAKTKAGTKKQPLNLVVTSSKRQQEVAALVADANLYANIRIDESEQGVEAIEELNILLNKPKTVKLEKQPARNEPCVCGSGKKYKKCCG